MHRRVAPGIVLVSVLAVVPAAMAQGRGRGANTTQTPAATSTVVAVGGFGREERRIIVDWFSDSRNLQGLPPGLAKREQLPPGLQRQLVKNGHLPPGLEKKIIPLPEVLEVRLPPLPETQKRVFIGGNIVLMNSSTSVIIDIFAVF
jgi:hypothetical protein